MPELGQKSFEAGWVPNDHPMSGRINGLLRMDNLNLDEDGALRMAKGVRRVSPLLGGSIRDIYSKEMNGLKHRYAALEAGAGINVVRDVGEAGTFATTVLSGTGSNVAAFDSTRGQVFISSGDTKVKDDGTTVRTWGIPKPTTAPTLVAEPPITINILNGQYENFVLLEGVSLTAGIGGEPPSSEADHLLFVTSSATNRARVMLIYGIDLTDFLEDDEGTNRDDDNDIFQYSIRVSDSSLLTKVRIEFLLEEPLPDDSRQIENYYYWEVNGQTDKQFNKGLDVWSTIKSKRSRVIKAGNNSDLTWQDVKGIRVIVEGSGTLTVAFNNLKIEGVNGRLSGNYTYYQVNVLNTGKYFGRSAPSPISEKIFVSGRKIRVTPSSASTGTFGVDFNEVWIYRKVSGDVQDDDTLLFDTLDIDTWYRVAVRTDFGTFVEDRSDSDALDENERINLFITDPPDNIVGIVGSYYNRTFAITKDKIYGTSEANPDSFDSRYIFDVSGEESERNLWIKKVSDSSMLIGTTNDIYELSGTMRLLPDGTVDALVRSLGVNNPPISRNATVHEGAIVYMSNDGWRLLTGSTYERLTANTSLLYKGETRHGVAPPIIAPNDAVNFCCAIADSKLYAGVTNASTPIVYIYDFIKKYWSLRFIGPISLYTEEDGTLLGGWGEAGNRYVRIIDTGSLLDEGTSDQIEQQMEVLTPFIDGGLPYNRKDLQTLKIKADTTNNLLGTTYSVNIQIAKDGELTFVDLGDFTFSGIQERTISLQDTSVNLGKSFQLKMSAAGVGVAGFYMMYWSINYEPRPEQRNHLHIHPTNYGISGRKRFYELPISIDTLGNSVNVTPTIDGVVEPVQAISTASKLTAYYLFTTEKIGREIGFDLKCSGDDVFEFYEIIPPRVLEKLPDPQQFFHIPYNNLGTPARKRFVRYAFVIDTRGFDVDFTPLIDGVKYASDVVNTNRKQTYIYYFNVDAPGTDIAGLLENATNEFEFYGLDLDKTISEVLPAPAEYLFLCTDFGTAARKRFSQISFVCNPRGGTIEFRVRLDGVWTAPEQYTGDRKQTFNYFFHYDAKFVDLCYEVRSLPTSPDLPGTEVPFEFYELLKPAVLEILPEPVKYHYIPWTNLNTDSRKRFIAFAIVIDTQGVDVLFTPLVDGVAGTPSTFNTEGKQTAIHYFTEETQGHDIGGILDSTDNAVSGGVPFEYYGVNFDETISEKMPAPAKWRRIVDTNFGIAARKRIRTIPMEINTRGGNVTYTPIVDDVEQTPSVFNNDTKGTVLHYFETDVFGIDFGGILSSDSPFEYYGMLTPENVETLPVGKKFDQVGPIEYSRIGKLIRARIRLVATGVALTWRMFAEDEEVTSGTIVTSPNLEKMYEVNFEKTRKAEVFRFELQSSNVFHRTYAEFYVATSGSETELKKIVLKEPTRGRA